MVAQTPFTGLAENEAETVQFAVIAPVVYVVPESQPPHPLAELVEYPLFGVIVNVVVEPEVIPVLEVGEIVPFAPAEVETVKVFTAQVLPFQVVPEAQLEVAGV